MFENSGRKILLGMMTGILFTSSLSVFAAEEDKKTYYLLDSAGKPVMSGTSTCVQTPQTPNDQNLAFEQCGDSLDSDGDGVPNDKDKCPGTPKGVKVDADGCPLDTDGDGVPDYKDKCPNNTKLEISKGVDADGCPLDSDGDGVPDYKDKCPDTPKGTKVDSNGCPFAGKITESTKVILAGDVTFAFGKYTLTPQGKKSLDTLAKDIVSSLDNISSITVTGHTDSVGSDKANQTLSERRAASVITYLVSKGVPKSLLVQRGAGETTPIADNKTKEGRARNRRVELDIRTK